MVKSIDCRLRWERLFDFVPSDSTLFSSDEGHVEIVHLLINHGADVDFRDKVSNVSTIVTVYDILLLLNNHYETFWNRTI